MQECGIIRKGMIECGADREGKGAGGIGGVRYLCMGGTGLRGGRTGRTRANGARTPGSP